MPLTQKTSFIKDPKPNMTTRAKNLHLASKLAVGPQVSRKIFKIERIEIGANGWMIYYRTGSA